MPDSLILKSTFTASPIGHIPKDFKRFVDLCKLAHIRYSDKKDKDGKEWREWFIAADDDSAVDKKGNMRGLKPTKHLKFCMSFHYVEFMNPEWNRVQIYNYLLNGDDEKLPAMLANTWQYMHNELADLGVNGYQRVSVSTKSFEKAFAEVDL